MKFLHAADIHLDSPLAGLARRDTVPFDVTHECTRRAFVNLIDLAIAKEVAFLIIAGDLYDGDWRDFNTGLFFAREIRRLASECEKRHLAPCPCIWLRGNHDAASVITRELTLPPNVYALSSHEAQTIRLKAYGVAIHGQSFPNRAVPEDLSAGYPDPLAGLINIGVLHTSAENPGEHEIYAPCRVESLVLKGYDYWALGHIHQRRVLHQRPWVVFSGNPQGRNVRESGAKGASLIEAESGRIVSVTHCPTDVLRWAGVAVDIGGAENLAEIGARVRFALVAAGEGAEGRPLILRLTLQGATVLHGALVADPEWIEAECRNAAEEAGGNLYLERLRFETRPRDAEEGLATDAVTQLAAPFFAALDDSEVQTALLSDLRNLATLCPRLPGQPVPDVPQTVEELRALAPEAWQMVAHRLTGSGTP